MLHQKIKNETYEKLLTAQNNDLNPLMDISNPSETYGITASPRLASRNNVLKTFKA